MESEGGANSYEDIRRQRLLDNKQRFEDLGLLKLSKSLSAVTKSEKKPQNRSVRPKGQKLISAEPRRSSRERKMVPSYHDEVDVALPPLRKRKRFDSSWASYLARPIEEVKSASNGERNRAYKLAEKVQSTFKSEKPSFVKSMLRSHVYSCFWLGLPARFCDEHLPKTTSNMVLEDEEGTEYDATFISKRTGLSGGWRAFALDHKLDDGDALVFHLVEPTRFKVYIVRAFDSQDEDDDNDPAVPDVGTDDAEETPKTVAKHGKKKERDESKNLNSSKKEKSSEVSVAVGRKLRNK